MVKIINKTGCLKRVEEFITKETNRHTTIVVERLRPNHNDHNREVLAKAVKLPINDKMVDWLMTRRVKDLTVVMEWKRRGSRSLTTGVFLQGELKIMCRVKQLSPPKFPITYKQYIKTESTSVDPLDFEYIYDQEVADDLEDLMAWIFGHEFFHFLCYTKQEKFNYETKANAFGFETMRKFKQWR